MIKNLRILFQEEFSNLVFYYYILIYNNKI